MENTFLCSLSTESIEDKDTSIWSYLRYETREITTSELLQAIENKRAFAGVFNKREITQKDKTIGNWKQTNIIPVDFDNRKMTFDEFAEMTETAERLKPTIIYNTQNDGVKGNRYRALYILNAPVTEVETYKRCYDRIVSHWERVTGEKNKDNCGGVVTQSFAGAKDKVIYYGVTYDVKNLLGDGEEHRQSVERERADIERKPFLNDFFKLSVIDVIEKYIGIYPSIESTPLTQADEEQAFILIPDDYMQIKRYWFQSNDAVRRSTYTEIRKIRDGEHRRKKLFINAIIRRLIMPSISFNHLLFNLLYEFHFYMINDGNTITRKDIYNIALRAYKADLSMYEELREKQKKHKFIVNPAYCIKHGISKNAAKRVAIMQMNNARIGEYYDLLKTEKENLQIMRDNGINISPRTLKRWKERNGITKKRNNKIMS